MIFSTQSKAFKNLQVQEDLFRVFLDFSDYAVLMLDSKGYIVSWNKGAEYIYGYTTAEIIEKHISHFYTQAEIEKGMPEQDLKNAKEKGRYERESIRHKKDGTPFSANTILTAVFDEDGGIASFANITRDISVQKKLEEENKLLNDQLEEKVKARTQELAIVNKELEAFSYSVSHDLRTPLRAISGYSMILKEDYESQLDDEGKRILNVILDNTTMMGELIDDLLSFSKMSRLEAVHESINMNKIVQSCIHDLLKKENQDQYNITIHPLPNCKGDPSMLRQVWLNLVGNALKYTSKKSKPAVEVGTIDDSGKNIYYVKDNGAGFDMKYYDKLFGVFQRLHRQDEFEGTGLGLALAKRIVSKHSGEIWGEASPGNGATFYFYIPKTI